MSATAADVVDAMMTRSSEKCCENFGDALADGWTFRLVLWELRVRKSADVHHHIHASLPLLCIARQLDHGYVAYER